MYVCTWDDRKSDANLRSRGFDFAYAARIFDALTVEREDVRRAYGEIRVTALGVVDGIQLTVVYTDRAVGNVLERRIISARRSSRRERTAYDQRLQNQEEPRSRPS